MIKSIWNNFSLSKKIIFSVFMVSLMTGVAISTMMYHLSKQKLTWEMDVRNQIIAKNVGFSFLTYLDGRAQTIASVSQSDKVMEDFQALHNIHAQHRAGLVNEKETEVYKKHFEDISRDTSNFLKNSPFIDIHFVDNSGDIIYGYKNKENIGKSITSGQLSGTALSNIFNEAIDPKQGKRDKAIYSGFVVNPSTNQEAMYFSSPVYNDKNEIIGAMIGELDMKTVFKRTNAKNVEDSVAYILQEKTNAVLTDIDSTPEDESVEKETLSAQLVSDILNPNLVASGKGIVYPHAYFQSSSLKVDGKDILFISERNSETFQIELDELRNFSILILLGCLLASSVLAFFISRSLSNPILSLQSAVTDMLDGKEVHLHEKERGDEIGALAGTLEAVYEAGQASKKVQVALDNAQSPLMMLDKELKISYVNQSLIDTMTKSQDYIRQNYSGVNLSQMVGTPFSAFHPQNTQNYVGRISGMSAYQIVPLKLGNRSFDVGVTPVNNARGERVGYISEWVEKTQEYLTQQEKDLQQAKEKEIEEELSRVIGIVAKGDFSARLRLNDNRPFIQSLANNINGLCEVVESFIDTASKSLQAVASGDLTQTMNARYEGRLAEMQDSINSTIHQLSSTINQIASLGQSIRSASGDISSGAEDLSSRTESQAASIQETVATMEEMSASVRMNADNAGKANSLSREALQQAKTGGNVVNSAVEAMKKLEGSSVRITEIVSVIDSIASQTNLLALNAAVEAARAGEAGKGFAVVASEVRSLASRCADAAHDIRELIMQSNGHVGEGVKLVNATGTSLMAIMGAVENVAQTIAAISSASREQATGVEEISNTINQMDEMTQQNASLSDESAAASRNLLAQASELSELVSYFKTGAGGTGSLSQAGQRLKQERHRQWG